ncbi:DBC1/CARP1 [Macleaya cordata]|uniref:DBC1/CARP1 n=1 Tax=Macleaya cordata TaxID=56857 RepID=A0A200R0T2_MACCD|nr:DBC1/CARP1 [Macleaya cordata]
MSLSLDALMDYNDKDIEESTFELSLFAESLYEMLQYQMGCRLLTFLQKLRLNYVKKRNQRKRERDENPEKVIDKEKSSRKRQKTTEVTPVEKDSTKAAIPDDANPDRKEEETAKEDASADGDDDSKMDYEADDYDPEEDVDEDQEMGAESPRNDTSKEAGNEETTAADAKPEKEIANVKVENEECVVGDKTNDKSAETGDNSNNKNKAAVVDTEKKEKPVKEEGPVVDKELLQEKDVGLGFRCAVLETAVGCPAKRWCTLYAAMSCKKVAHSMRKNIQ